MRRLSRRPVIIANVIWLLALPAGAQSGAKDGEWRTYGGDLGHTRYSPLDRINAANFNKLEVAWRFKADALGPRPEFQFEATPLMVHGKLYSTAGSRRAVVCLDAATGELLWMHSENEGARFWLSVITDIQNRGVKDILIASIDNLKGFAEAIETVFPKRPTQNCYRGRLIDLVVIRPDQPADGGFQTEVWEETTFHETAVHNMGLQVFGAHVECFVRGDEKTGKYMIVFAHEFICPQREAVRVRFTRISV